MAIGDEYFKHPVVIPLINLMKKCTGLLMEDKSASANRRTSTGQSILDGDDYA